MKAEFEISSEQFDNIAERYNDVFLIESKPDAYINDLMVGIIRFVVNVKEQRQYLKNGDYVLFPEKRMAWQCNPVNDHFICLVKSHWVKPYKHDLKLPVIVPIQIRKVNPQTNEIIYVTEFEEIEMTYNQYVNRRMLIDFHQRPYGLLMAYENHKKRQSKYNDYYRALNETARQYMIEHKILKDFISEVNHKKKKYKKDWTERKTALLENRLIEKELDEILQKDDVDLQNEGAKIYNFSDVRF